MKNNTLLASALFIVSTVVLAEQSLLEGVAKQAAKDTAAAVAPGAVERAEQADQALKDAKQIKENAQKAPDAMKKQAQDTLEETAKQKLEQATPEHVKEGAQAIKSGAETAKQLKGQAENLPKSSSETVKTLKHKTKAEAQKKASEKALELLNKY